MTPGQDVLPVSGLKTWFNTDWACIRDDIS